MLCQRVGGSCKSDLRVTEKIATITIQNIDIFVSIQFNSIGIYRACISHIPGCLKMDKQEHYIYRQPNVYSIAVEEHQVKKKGKYENYVQFVPLY